MNRIAVLSLLLYIASTAMATNHVRRFVIKDATGLVYPDRAAFAAHASQPVRVPEPAAYHYDARFNPNQFSYPYPAPVTYYAAPPEYVLPQPLPAYVATFPAPAPVPPVPASAVPVPAHGRAVPAAAPLSAVSAPIPAPAANLPTHFLTRLQAHQFIDRYFPHAYHH